ncbi:MAG: phosphoribosylamine--glycine ligase [Verrucomicrobiota bacterium]|nr:phosphoribosylamine--glycine ligase [Verrucomicrobiota bacterium]
MKVLVIGSGGREHTLSWKLAQSPQVEKVYCAPGNSLMKGIEQISLLTEDELIDFAEREKIDLTIVGPEVPLCDGIVDVFRKRGLKIFGPDKEASQLEGSKKYAKSFMDKYEIPTADAKVFLDLESAEKYIVEQGVPIVVKADGLAAGKGVTVALTLDDALNAVQYCFEGGFGEAGTEVVVEEFLSGEEASILAFTDGKTILPLASSQDHKRLLYGDKGPNTGGMGAYSPAPIVTDEIWEKVDKQVLQPFLRGCQQENLNYRGIIYAGIMIEGNSIKVLEFNVRFGDPETQAVLTRMESDLFEAMNATVEQRLDELNILWKDKASVCVVMASGGYPNTYEKGKTISGIEAAEETGAYVFHSGTKDKDGSVLTAGGRVLGVTALGHDIATAQINAYKAVEKISWEDVVYRKDIASKAL